MTPMFPNISVQLSGRNGNAFSILGIMDKALRDAGVDKGTRENFQRDATSGDYDHLLRTCMAWVDVA